MVKSPANGGVKRRTPKQLLQAVLADCMQLRSSKGELSGLAPHVRGTKVEKLVQTSVMGTFVRLGVPLDVVIKDEAPAHHPALLAISSVFGGKSLAERAAILNDPERLFLPKKHADVTTMVIQPFAKTQGCVDFILIMGRRIIPVSVKSWKGGGAIKNNSSPLHAGVVYICISHSKHESRGNLIYHGSMLEEDELAWQHLVTTVMQKSSNRANANAPSGVSVINNSHRPSRDVGTKLLKEKLLGLVPASGDPWGGVVAMVASRGACGKWPAFDIAAATTQAKQDALWRSMYGEGPALVSPFPAASAGWQEGWLAVSCGHSIALSSHDPAARQPWQADVTDLGMFFGYPSNSATRH